MGAGDRILSGGKVWGDDFRTPFLQILNFDQRRAERIDVPIRSTLSLLIDTCGGGDVGQVLREYAALYGPFYLNGQ